MVIPETVPYTPLRGPLLREIGQDGVLVLTIDVPGEKVNTLGKAMMADFDALLADLEVPGPVRAMVIRSGNPLVASGSLCTGSASPSCRNQSWSK